MKRDNCLDRKVGMKTITGPASGISIHGQGQGFSDHVFILANWPFKALTLLNYSRVELTVHVEIISKPVFGVL